MTEKPDPEIDAAEAFERVCNKLSLLHSAIEGLTAARERTPDYSATLGNMAEALRSLDTRVGQIEHSRALSLSPVALAEEIHRAAQAVRSQDSQNLAEAQAALSSSLGWINSMINRGQAVERRTEREWMLGAGGLLAGILVWSVLPGVIVRSLPESWHAPEWMAARMMGLDQAEAGERMLKAAEIAEGE